MDSEIGKDTVPSKIRLLVADDSREMRDVIAEALGSEYELIQAVGGREAIELSINQRPDIVLLDIEMPGIDGIQVCDYFRKDEKLLNIPIVVVSGILSENLRTQAYECGADDCLSKPFSIRELKARISSKLRRNSRAEKNTELSSLIRCGNLQISPAMREVTIDSSEVKLTYIEFEILLCLAGKRGTVVDRSEIQNRLWQSTTVVRRTLDVHVHALRKKITANCSHEISTVRRAGFLLREKRASKLAF